MLVDRAGAPIYIPQIFIASSHAGVRGSKPSTHWTFPATLCLILLILMTYSVELFITNL